ncbi:MAG: AzlD domain-containing protein [Coriobacteriia bacterium]|nr:AzlD domain-containing protein [Coriobacteriia bacterium]MCL2870022.1 AzlD domain-containing protein [Coriobacteriia bacterium]
MELTSQFAIWGLIAGMLVLNFALRFIPLAVLSRISIPEPLMRWLSYMPIAVMGALIATEVLLPALDTFFNEVRIYQEALPYAECGSTTPVPYPIFFMPLPGILGVIAAMVTYRYTKSFIGGTLAGVVVFALLQLLVGA